MTRSGGTAEVLRSGDTVPLGSDIETGADGRVVLSRSGDVVTVAAKSRMTLPTTEAGGAMTKIKQALGTLLFKVHTRPSWGFEVQTPTMVAVVKGTTFTVSVKNGGSALHVTEGAVQVANAGGGGTTLVHRGQTAKVSSAPGAGVTVTDKSGKAVPADQHGSKPERRSDAAEPDGKTANAEGAKAGRTGVAASAGAQGANAITQEVGGAVDFSAASNNLVNNASGTVREAAAGKNVVFLEKSSADQQRGEASIKAQAGSANNGMNGNRIGTTTALGADFMSAVKGLGTLNGVQNGLGAIAGNANALGNLNRLGNVGGLEAGNAHGVANSPGNGNATGLGNAGGQPNGLGSGLGNGAGAAGNGNGAGQKNS